MPYIVRDDRKILDTLNGGDSVAKYLATRPKDKFAGDLNYLNFKIIKTYIAANGKKYVIFAVILGSLLCCILEVYRRLVANYEEQKIKDNGDVEI